MTLSQKSGRVKRPYRSPRREAQAEATRQAILDAAHELFLTNGYAATSIRAIARAAEVSDQTVYTNFGDKPTLLAEVGLRVVSGEALPGDEPPRDFLAELQTADEVVERLGIVAAWARSVYAGGMLAFESMLLDAAGSDARAAEVAEQMWARKYEDNKLAFAIAVPPESLPAGIDFDEAYDIVFALDSAAFIRILIEDRGWSWDNYERWMATILVRLFTTGEKS